MRILTSDHHRPVVNHRPTPEKNDEGGVRRSSIPNRWGGGGETRREGAVARRWGGFYQLE